MSGISWAAMSPKLVFCVISSFLFLCTFHHAAGSSKSCEIFKSKPPQDAYSPINIITKNAIPLNAPTKLTYKNTGLGPIVYKNTGFALETYGYPAILSGGFLKGGVLCGVSYKFALFRYYFSKDLNGRSYNQIDGKGSPLTLAAHFYDPKYGSFQEALKHPGGVVILNYMITYYEGPIPNPLFFPTGLAVRLFRNAGSTFPLGPELLYFLWFSPVFLVKENFAFWGSYFDPETGTEYPNVIQIQTSGIHPYLSKSQLELFQTLKNKNGEPLETVAPIHPGGQTVYKVGSISGALLYVPSDLP